MALDRSKTALWILAAAAGALAGFDAAANSQAAASATVFKSPSREFVSVPVSQQSWLVDQVIHARSRNMTEVEHDALRRIVLANPSNLWAKMDLMLFAAPRGLQAEVEQLRRSMCGSPGSEACKVAEEYLHSLGGSTGEKVQQLQLLQTASRFDQAVSLMEQLYGKPPARSFHKLRYYRMMLKIPERVDEGLSGLAQLQNDKNASAVVRRLAFLEERRTRLELYSDFGLDHIRDKDPETQQRAMRMLSDALDLAPDDPRAGRWRSNLREAQFWSYMRKAESALKAGDDRQAEYWYTRAHTLQESPYGWTGLATIAQKRGQYEKAKQYICEAIARSRGESEAEQKRLRDWILRLDREKTGEMARSAQQKGNWEQAISLLQQSARLDPDDPWTRYRLAGAYEAAGRKGEMLSAFSDVPKEKFRTSAWAYPYALTLYLSGQLEQAADVIDGVRDDVPQNMKDLRRTIANAMLLKLADEFSSSGQDREALQALEGIQNPEAWIVLKRARIAEALGEHDRALADYALLEGNEEYAAQAVLRQALLRQKAGDIAGALEQADKVRSRTGSRLGLSDIRDLAQLYRSAGRDKTALALLEEHSAQALLAERDEAALYFRDYATAVKNDLDRYRPISQKGFYLAGLTAADKVSDEDWTAAMRSPDEPDGWLRNSMRGQAEEVYQGRNVEISTGLFALRDAGTEGYSDLKEWVWMTEASMPVSDGRLTVRTDTVNRDVGRLVSGEYSLGSCGPVECSGSSMKSDRGQSIALQWQNERWKLGIGTTPVGFVKSTVVGGVTYWFDALGAGWSVEAFRQAKGNSLLSYGGMKDPATGMTWGRVTRTGGALNFSWDKGEANGVWAKMSSGVLAGHNVERNWDVQLMAGYYRRLLQKPNHEITAGLTGMLWHFDKDLSGYTFGQGGYYSPQRYGSMSVSLEDAGRTGEWAWTVRGSVGLSHAKKESVAKYPKKDRIRPFVSDDKLTELDAMTRSDSSSGVSYSARAALERRLNAHFVLGVAGSISKGEGYRPRYGVLYLRWHQMPWNGNLPMPVRPMVPYYMW